VSKPITRLFIDTSILRGVSFSDPDFNKLLDRSRSGTLEIFVPHIAWEERRAQFLDHACSDVRKIRETFESLENRRSDNFVLQSLRPPTLSIWDYAEIEEQSKEAMSEFAAKHKIQVLDISPEHARRAWRSYFQFGSSPPFAPERKARRDDIPDSWIYEAAADLLADGGGLVALCSDGKLASALRTLGAEVLDGYGAIVAQIEQFELAAKTPAVDTASTAAPPSLDGLLSADNERFRSLERRMLGYVAYFNTPTKDQIFGLLIRDDVTLEMAQNTVQRLVIKGLVRDTGNHFLVPDENVAAAAKAAVEEEIIQLLDKS
jgi:predicted nucleic acid-binding protein